MKERQCYELGKASDGTNLKTVILKTSKTVVLLDKTELSEQINKISACLSTEVSSEGTILPLVTPTYHKQLPWYACPQHHIFFC